MCASHPVEQVTSLLPPKLLKGKLVVDVLSVKRHAKEVMLRLMPPDADIVCLHPMFGPDSGKNGWQGLPCVYDQVRAPVEPSPSLVHPSTALPRGGLVRMTHALGNHSTAPIP